MSCLRHFFKTNRKCAICRTPERKWGNLYDSISLDVPKHETVMESIASKTMRQLQRAFEKRARAQFGERLRKLEWVDDDPYEPSGERMAGLLHAALHIKRAKPQDSSLSASIAYQVMADFDDTFLIMTHTLPE